MRERDEYGRFAKTAKMSESGESSDEALLKRIRDRYRYYDDSWREVRDERKTDMRYLSGDPWTAEDRRARADAGRPCINHDELTQYVNQATNNLRQNKRGVIVKPAGNGATDDTAEFWQNLIRTIEYDSQAQSAYITAFENAIQGGYGFFRISREYAADSSFDQKLSINNIPNPDSVLYDPDCRKADWSDARGCFVLEPVPRDDFARRFPEAQKLSFSADDAKQAPGWIQEKLILIAEYYEVEVTQKTLYLLPDGRVVDELKEGQNAIKTRKAEKRTVHHYLTNGVEILEPPTEEPGPYIPIIPVTGREMYVDEGSGAKRKLISLVRLARDPQMSLAYLNSQQMEEAGLTPKTPYVGYKGQFESDVEAWDTATKIPHAYLQADPITDTAAQSILPLPRREQFTPNFAAFEIAKDSCRRAVQSAMGITPLPTAAQRNNEKSGKALQAIQQQQFVGSFHFNDNFERSLMFCGRVLMAQGKTVYDTERELALIKPDNSHQIVKINTAAPYVDKDGEKPQHYQTDKGDHSVTVSTGPSSESQREAAGDFLDLFVQNLQTLPVPPPQAAKLLAMAVKNKGLGPMGDQMAEIIAPTQEGPQLPPEVMQAVQTLQGQVQALNAYGQEKEKEVQKLEFEKQAQIVKHQGDMELEMLKQQGKVAEAEVLTKAQNVSERLAAVEQFIQQQHDQAHDRAMQAEAQAHEVEMASQQHAQALEQQDQAGQQQSALAAQQAAAQPEQPAS